MHKPVYDPIPSLQQNEIEAALVRNDPEELLIGVLSAALYLEDRIFAQKVCIRLSEHPHFNVRGNALLGFAHIARIDGELDEAKVKPLIKNGLVDNNDYVRGQAEDAVDDIEHFLDWKF